MALKYQCNREVLLDKYLEGIPDRPQTETLTLDCKTIYGVPSNSIIDWARTLGINAEPVYMTDD